MSLNVDLFADAPAAKKEESQSTIDLFADAPPAAGKVQPSAAPLEGQIGPNGTKAKPTGGTAPVILDGAALIAASSGGSPVDAAAFLAGKNQPAYSYSPLTKETVYKRVSENARKRFGNRLNDAHYALMGQYAAETGTTMAKVFDMASKGDFDTMRKALTSQQGMWQTASNAMHYEADRLHSIQGTDSGQHLGQLMGEAVGRSPDQPVDLVSALFNPRGFDAGQAREIARQQKGEELQRGLKASQDYYRDSTGVVTMRPEALARRELENRAKWQKEHGYDPKAEPIRYISDLAAKQGHDAIEVISSITGPVDNFISYTLKGEPVPGTYQPIVNPTKTKPTPGPLATGLGSLAAIPGDMAADAAILVHPQASAGDRAGAAVNLWLKAGLPGASKVLQSLRVGGPMASREIEQVFIHDGFSKAEAKEATKAVHEIYDYVARSGETPPGFWDGFKKITRDSKKDLAKNLSEWLQNRGTSVAPEPTALPQGSRPTASQATRKNPELPSPSSPKSPSTPAPQKPSGGSYIVVSAQTTNASKLLAEGFIPLGSGRYAAPSEQWATNAVHRLGLEPDPKASEVYTAYQNEPHRYEFPNRMNTKFDWSQMPPERQGQAYTPRTETDPETAIENLRKMRQEAKSPPPQSPPPSQTAPASKATKDAQGLWFIDAWTDPKNIGVYPGLQYKKVGIVDVENGIGNDLKGITTYDKGMPPLTVWMTKDGKLWVVNGHHRRELAIRTNTDRVPIRVYREDMGVNFATARALGALQNIRDMKGTAIDAATVLRDLNMPKEALATMGLNLKSGLARDAVNLLNLTPESLAMVENGEVPETVAAAIAETGLDPKREQAALRSAAAGGLETRRQGLLLGEQAKTAPMVDKTDGMGDLFGGFDEELALAEQAKLADAALKRLASSKRALSAFQRMKAVGKTTIDTEAQNDAAAVQEFGAKVLSTDEETARILSQEATNYAKNPTKAQLTKSVDRIVAAAEAAADRRLAELKPRSELGSSPEPRSDRTEPPARATPSPEPIASPPTGDPKTATALRKAADSLLSQIESKRNPAIAGQNPTARRAGIIAGMLQEADAMEQIQQILNRLAELHDSGTIPAILSNITSRAQVEAILRYSGNWEGVYLHRSTLNTALKAATGKKGIADIRSALDRMLYGRDDTFTTTHEKEIKALEDLAKLVAISEKWESQRILNSVKNWRRFQRMGLGTKSKILEAKAALVKLLKPVEVDPKAEIRRMERELIGTKLPGFFPTPRPIIDRMIEIAGIESGDTVLEPSAGKGDIAEAITEAGANPDTFEISSTLRELLKAKGFDPGMDFLEAKGKHYDKILMNPPFENGQDITHVQHAFSLLKPGGRLVAIMSEGPFYRMDKKASDFRTWLEAQGGTSEKLEAGSFQGKDSFRQTGVSTRLVVIDKGKAVEPKNLNPSSGGLMEVPEDLNLTTPEESKPATTAKPKPQESNPVTTRQLTLDPTEMGDETGQLSFEERHPKTDLPKKERSAYTVDEFKQRIDFITKVARAGGANVFRDLKMAGARGVFIAPTVKFRLGRIRLKDELSDAQFADTLAHEVGHQLDMLISAKAKGEPPKRPTGKIEVLFGVGELAAEVIEKELIEVTKALVGPQFNDDPAYFLKPQELFARFMQSIMFHPQLIEEFAPIAYQAIAKQSEKFPLMADYINIARGGMLERPQVFYFLPDARQGYIKKLGRYLGTKAYGEEVLYRSRRAQALAETEALVNSKFKDVKDKAELLFDAAEGIKTTINGQPVFGTKMYKQIEVPNELDLDEILKGSMPLKMGKKEEEFIDEVKSMVLGGFKLMGVDDYGTALFEKWRKTPEEAEMFWNALSDKGKDLIREYTADLNEAKDLFNRDLMKEVFKVEGDIEGYVHHFGFESSIKNVWKKLLFKERKAALRKHRAEAEGFTKDLRLSVAKGMAELKIEKIWNEFVTRQVALTAEPLPPDEKGPTKPGWVAIEGDAIAGLKLLGENKTVFLKEDGTSFLLKRGKKYQIPNEVYERYIKGGAFGEELHQVTKIFNSINRYWQMNILVDAGTAATNLISGGIQFSARLLEDFYKDVLYLDGAHRTVANIAGFFQTMTPQGWKQAKDWVFGGDESLLYHQIYGQKGAITPIDQIYDKALKPYQAIEQFWKKVIVNAEVQKVGGLGALRRGAKKLDTGEVFKDDEFIKAVNDVIDLYAYDYQNQPVWMERARRSPFTAGVKPFMIYPYKYAKMMTNLAGGAFDKNLPIRDRMAKMLALGTIITAYALYKKAKSKQQKVGHPNHNAPSNYDESVLKSVVNPRGRLFMGRDASGKEVFLRTAKYPFLNVYDMIESFTEGDPDGALEIVRDQVGTIGPIGKFLLNFSGYRGEFDTYKDLATMNTETASSFIPFNRPLKELADILDPKKRNLPSTPGQVLGQFVPTTNQEFRKWLVGPEATVRVPFRDDEIKLLKAGNFDGAIKVITERLGKDAGEELRKYLREREAKRSTGKMGGFRETLTLPVPKQTADEISKALGGIILKRVDREWYERFRDKAIQNAKDRLNKEKDD